MKKLVAIFLLTVTVLLSGSLANKAAAQARVDVSYQDFYDELSPYGQWIDYPEYGYVWVPNERDGFRPYSSGGHWVWSDDYEWIWVSDYSWGWAPFHYGRWFEDPGYGWMWMPGYEWAPAWVAWRDGGDYYGWAPLRPGINISVGFSIGSYNPPIDYWCFAPRRYITSRSIGNYCLDRGRNVTIINNTTIINNYSRRGNNVFVTGPRRADAERYAGRIASVRFQDASRPGRARFSNNRVSMYRPQVSHDNNRQFAPRNFNRYDNARNNGTAIRNGNNTTGRRNVFDRSNENRNNDNGRVRERNTSPGTNDNTRPNVFDRSNNTNRDRRVTTPQTNTNPGEQNPARRNVFDRGNRVNNNNNNDRRVERRSVEARPQQNTSQPQRRNVFDRPTQQRTERQPQQQPRMQRQQQPRVERQQQPRMERQQQPRMQRPQQQPQRSAPAQRSGNDGGGRRNVFDRHH